MYTLLADSGSTKTDWILIEGSEVIVRIKTIGFNPYFQTADQISHAIINLLKPALTDYLSHITQVYYYGTGCSTPDNCKIIEESLASSLSISKVKVSHDLLAAARALCKSSPGIAAILGTGSNSCLYNGKEIVENAPSTGYLWSDYGGGSQIGKFFIKEYFEDTLPRELKMAFEEAGYNRNVILDGVYKKGVPGKYLASVSLFLGPYLQHPFVKDLLTKCFDSFFIHQVNKYTGSRNYRVNTVGSVGYYYKDLIAEVAEKHGYQMGLVIQSPLEELIHFHAHQ